MGAFFVFFEIALHIVIKSFKSLGILIRTDRLRFPEFIFSGFFAKNIFHSVRLGIASKVGKIIESSNSVLNSIRSFLFDFK